MLSVKIDGKVLKSNALKSDTGRYYPARHSHPWVSFVFVLCTRPMLEARALWHHATRCSVGGGLFEEPVSEAAWPLTSQIPLAKPDPCSPPTPLSLSLHFLQTVLLISKEMQRKGID